MAILSNQPEPTINHMSHTHTLHLIHHNPTLTLAPISCSGCKILLSQGLTYTCTLCNYYLHIKCSQMPQQIKHPSDQAHAFSLLATPLYPEGVFRCDACGEKGSGFSYHCRDCGTDLHILCASMPMSVTHHSHPHKLDLIFSPPYLNNNFSCDVCKKVGGSHWLYRCSFCEFDAHLGCGTSQALLAQTHPTVRTNQYQNVAGVSIPVFQPPSQTPTHSLQQSFSGYRAAAEIPSPGTNQPQFNYMNYVNPGARGPNYSAGAPSFTAPQYARQQTFPGQKMPGAGDNNKDAVIQFLIQQLSNNSGAGGDVNAQLLQAIIRANGGANNAQMFQNSMNVAGGGGSGQALQGLMGGTGGVGGNLNLNSLLGGLDISSLMGMVTGFGMF